MVDPDDVVAGLDAGGHRNRGRRGVGDLGVGLHQRRIGEGAHREIVRLAVDAALPTFVDGAGGYGRDAHSVRDEEDHASGRSCDQPGVETALEVFGRRAEVRVIHCGTPSCAAAVMAITDADVAMANVLKVVPTSLLPRRLLLCESRAESVEPGIAQHQ